MSARAWQLGLFLLSAFGFAVAAAAGGGYLFASRTLRPAERSESSDTGPSALFLLVSQSPPIAFLSPSPPLPPRPEGVSSFRRAQVTIIKSPAVLGEVVKKKEVNGLAIINQQADPLAWLSSHLAAELLGGGEEMRISMPEVKPQDAVLLINAVADAYFDQHIAQEKKLRRTRIDQLQEFNFQYRDRVKRIHVDLAVASQTLSNKGSVVLCRA
jgi:hypothetical protein